MALPTVAVNSGTGSDTLASGAGPSVALAGTLAATHASVTVNITDAVDLSGVAVDGSAVLWVATSSGRRWSAVSAISGTSGNWTVTVVTAYGLTESGKSWAIGGKRATCAGSLQLFLDFLPGWVIDIQTGETLAASIVVTPASPVTGTFAKITSTTGSIAAGTLPLLQTAADGVHLLNITGATNLLIENLSLKCTAGTPGRGVVPVTSHSFNVVIRNCVIDGFFNGIDGQDGTYQNINNCIVDGCEIKNCTTYGYVTNTAVTVVNCYVHNNASNGVVGINTGQTNYTLVNNVFANNGASGVLTASVLNGVVVGNTFAGNAADGFQGNSTSTAASYVFANNVFYGNTTAGVAFTAAVATQPSALINHNNAYGANGSARVNFPAGTNDVTLTANPFVSASDFALNSTAGGGAACKAAGARAPNVSAAAPAPDVGAVQTGAGASTDPGVANVKAGTTYAINGASLTGTLAAGGGASRYRCGLRGFG